MLNYLYVRDHYDHPLEGLCIIENKIHRFERDYETDDYEIYSLTKIEIMWSLFDKWLFEKCVNNIWSYDQEEKLERGASYKQKFWYNYYIKLLILRPPNGKYIKTINKTLIRGKW